jgi:hypothetical protein
VDADRNKLLALCVIYFKNATKITFALITSSIELLSEKKERATFHIITA